MKKHLIIFTVAALLCTLLCCGVSADVTRGPRIVDGADLLTDDEEAALLNAFDVASERLQFDIVAVTADDLGGKSAMEYADDFFDYNGYGYGENYDGALLLISVEPDNRRCWISTCGSGITIVDSDTIENMLDVIIDDHLYYGDYCGGIAAFATLCERTHDDYIDSITFSSDKLFFWIAFGVIAGLIVAAIYVGVLKSKMKSVRSQAAANDYVRPGSLNITNAQDIFLYRTVNRTRRESSSSSGGSHTSSSGRSHGGGGRSF